MIGNLDNPRMAPYSIVGQSSSTLLYTGLYVYDGAGNISRIGGPLNYQYDAANRLATIPPIECVTMSVVLMPR